MLVAPLGLVLARAQRLVARELEVGRESESESENLGRRRERGEKRREKNWQEFVTGGV